MLNKVITDVYEAKMYIRYTRNTRVVCYRRKRLQEQWKEQSTDCGRNDVRQTTTEINRGLFHSLAEMESLGVSIVLFPRVHFKVPMLPLTKIIKWGPDVRCEIKTVLGRHFPFSGLDSESNRAVNKGTATSGVLSGRIRHLLRQDNYQ